MYEICQNEFRLGAAAPNYHFSSRGECDLDVKYRCIIARAREEYQVGRFPLLLFQDNPFESGRPRRMWREIRLHQSAALYSLFFFYLSIELIPESYKRKSERRFCKVNWHNLTRFNSLIMYYIECLTVAIDFSDRVVPHILSERLVFAYGFGTFTIVREQRAFNASIKPIRVDRLICRENLMPIRWALFYEYITSPLFCTDRYSYRRFYGKQNFSILSSNLSL